MRKGHILLWGFRAPRDLIRSAFGTLEQQVLDVVSQKGSATVRVVQAGLHQPAAYTTVMTTLDRLYRKGLIARTKTGRMFVYTATKSREELEASIAVDLVAGLLSGNALTPAHPLLSNLVDAVGDRDRALLDELERLVKAKRDQLNIREKP